MILEGIVTTVCADGRVNISPMGPQVEPDMRELLLRPYQTSTTYQNLKRTGQGVFHVTDDVWLLAQAAVGAPDPPPELIAAESIEGFILAGACRWYAFRVRELDDREPRTTILTEVVAQGSLRDFFGFNRAKHAVVEAAILATRIGILPGEQITSEMARLAIPVEKTGGTQERRAFAFLAEYVHSRLKSSA
jgi:hypothetical protein